jgi:hypothetical protein
MQNDLQCYIQTLGDIGGGRWIDVTIDQKPLDDWEFWDEIDTVLSDNGSEEWVIGDWDAPGEYPCLRTIDTVEELVILSEGYSDWGIVFLEIWENSNSPIDTISAEDHFHFESWDEVVENYMEVWEVQPPVAYYIDEEKLLRDIKLEGDFIEAQDGTIIQVL